MCVILALQLRKINEGALISLQMQLAQKLSARDLGIQVTQWHMFCNLALVEQQFSRFPLSHTDICIQNHIS